MRASREDLIDVLDIAVSMLDVINRAGMTFTDSAFMERYMRVRAVLDSTQNEVDDPGILRTVTEASERNSTDVDLNPLRERVRALEEINEEFRQRLEHLERDSHKPVSRPGSLYPPC